MVGIGVVGYGYWGPNLVRNFAEADGAKLVAVCDLDQGRRNLVERRFPGVKTFDNLKDMLALNDVDAVVLATPVSTHFELGLQVLRAGRHVLVEKPLTATVDEGKRLLDEAERQNRIVMVDHTFIYTGAVRKIKDVIEGGQLGDLYYYDSVRVNLGLFQHDVSVIWDLAVHDLSIMDYVMPGRPVAVSATGISHVPNQPENTAYLTVFFDRPQIAHVHVNWLAPLKVRKTLIGGSRKMIVYDDLEPSEKIKIYDKGIEIDNSEEQRHEMLIGYRTGDMMAPKIDGLEALRGVATEFVQSISQKRQPCTDGSLGLRVVQLLDAASRSMAARGKPVDL